MEEQLGNHEKRSKVRIPFIYGIEYEEAETTTLLSGDALKETPIVIKDVSADGLQIATPRFIPEHTEVSLHLCFPRPRYVPDGQSVEADCFVKAAVKWVDRNQNGSGFRVGLLFTQFRDDARGIIDKYLEDNIIADEDIMR